MDFLVGPTLPMSGDICISNCICYGTFPCINYVCLEDCPSFCYTRECRQIP